MISYVSFEKGKTTMADTPEELQEEDANEEVVDTLTGMKASIDDSTIEIDDSIEDILEALGEGKPLDQHTITLLRGEISEAHGYLEMLNELLFVLSEHYMG